MQYLDQVNQLDHATIDKLTTAVEIGKWENGEKLTDRQRESAMQANSFMAGQSHKPDQ
ncbi:MAG: DUF1315 family protein [Enterobacterales bacterium]|nr:DUF1315 family protein [Enterobacterales bacterium]